MLFKTYEQAKAYRNKMKKVSSDFRIPSKSNIVISFIQIKYIRGQDKWHPIQYEGTYVQTINDRGATKYLVKLEDGKEMIVERDWIIDKKPIEKKEEKEAITINNTAEEHDENKEDEATETKDEEAKIDDEALKQDDKNA